MFLKRVNGKSQILAIIIAVCLTYITGCSNGMEYTQTETEESSDGTIYKCVHQQVEPEENMIDNFFTLTKEPDDQNLSLHGEGKFQCMTLSEEGNLLCIAIRPYGGATHDGHKYYSSDYELIFVKTDTLKESHRWRIRPQKKPDGSEMGMQRFDDIDISDDGTLVITYYWKDYNKKVINLWDVKTGELIQEFFLPPADPDFQKLIHGIWVSDLTISQNNDCLAVVGFRATKGSGNVDPRCFFYVWDIENGTRKKLGVKEFVYIKTLFFDETGNYIASQNETQNKKSFMVYDVNESKLVYSQEVNDSIERINWDEDKKAFQIKFENQTDIFISLEELKKLPKPDAPR